MTKALAEILLRRIEGLGEEDESAVCATQLVIRAST
jgi:DNA-binding LacI/PurR family transcriptional regulator